jgi:glycosyltransferase involved in cell wall biosynthesis
MRIHIPNESKQQLGGGFTFIRNFEKYADRMADIVVTTGPDFDPAEIDILFIAGATMVKRELVEKAKAAGIKVVLRVDNAPRNSRNRNTGTSRLKDFAQLADLVIYQSRWAMDYLAPFVEKYGPIILNGVDEEIFKMGTSKGKAGAPTFMFTQYNRDETKRWHEAWYEYSMAQRVYKNAHLWIVGNFSPEQIQYNFDFFMGEKYTYLGVMDDPEEFAQYLRAVDWLLIPYYNDACSNTLVEARLCGVQKFHYSNTGGTPEIMAAPMEHLKASYMTERYIEEFKKII